MFPLESDDPREKANFIFVTSRTFDGDLGGLAGADAKCQQAAADAHLDGTFVAWMSDSSTNAAERLGDARGWVRVSDREIVVDSIGDLVTRGPLLPLSVTESGADAPDGLAWTGTKGDGSRVANTCGDWTSADTNALGKVGQLTYGSFGFTAAGDSGCGASLRLFCFGIDKHVELPLPPRDPDAAVAFVSMQVWSPTSTITAADDICQMEAELAGLSGTYLAALSATNAASASRFPVKRSYVRSDGVSIGLALTSTQPVNFLHLSADGTLVFSRVWTGGLPGSTPTDTLNDNCDDWSVPDATQAIFGTSIAGNVNALMEGRQNCLDSFPVYCFPM